MYVDGAGMTALDRTGKPEALWIPVVVHGDGAGGCHAARVLGTVRRLALQDDAGMLIRRDLPEDHAAVRAILAAAFADPAAPAGMPVEVGLVDALRAGGEWMPPLSMVAESEGGEIIGYVVCTRGWVDGDPALGLGPLAVLPAVQGRGVGSALMHAVLGAADALEEPLVALLGHTEYYPRFGFRSAAEVGIAPPAEDWASHFQVRTLSAYRPGPGGVFRYARAFDDV